MAVGGTVRLRRGLGATAVQLHVAALDALGRERAQRREVLTETDRRNDRGELAGAFDREHAEREPGERVHPAGRADGADGGGKLEEPAEPIALDLPDRERAVLA